MRKVLSVTCRHPAKENLEEFHNRYSQTLIGLIADKLNESELRALAKKFEEEEKKNN
ncbi:hypothetical protein [Oceanirhabdus sp. W0125-5]|uniref:hypothetical protein n=1 Tax=Oceanirhabdus sp. W0125-5 TaxID=2999116 RepID=UPI0022F2BEC6|nr:hypothetical protein [Oceanirhabdus sp. W0125-5]WBW95280.1 hypothetical protein OW730_16480 [Oceanirhabdus sp. W0125-5]